MERNIHRLVSTPTPNTYLNYFGKNLNYQIDCVLVGGSVNLEMEFSIYIFETLLSLLFVLLFTKA